MSNEGFRSVLLSIARTKGATVTVFSDFCRIAACSLAIGRREEEYLDTAKAYSRDELSDLSLAFAKLVQEMEQHPFTDLLGPFYLECAAHSSKQARGEFYTPPEISQLIARMTVDVEEVKRKGVPISVNEPACGSGGMALALAQLFAPDSVDLLRITAQDINPVATDMCYINLTLWGVPAHVVLGDTIRMTVTRAWKNVHWHRVGEDQRQALGRLKDLAGSVAQTTPDMEIPQRHFDPDDGRGQFLLNL
ncbi:SAM-dependent DNA methyltransferase [Luteolibacter ambystomatis]|uniref:site-specific DNA-methyltransferase (adenine-specific) n=1 Tax=Luteolibacter ambystomatis TaxID=2824561 RepID=A0A975PGF4_9BACT|nr:N-6 DNA methylase [Luteolibacter ambystomatis]QUE52257.1 SAM-dependent DNA methyltransferase [Luteolibacter ambystomatis]